jgi:outer membrane protein
MAQTSPLGTFDREVTEFLPEGARLVAGGGLGMISQPYTGADTVRFVPEPLVVFQSEKFSFVGRTLAYRLYDDDIFSFSAIAEWRFFGHDGGEDSPFLIGMEERKGTAEVGFRAEVEREKTHLAATARTDALSRHGGFELEGRISYELSSWAPLSVRPNAGVRYQSGDLTNYYFGVERDEAITPGQIGQRALDAAGGDPARLGDIFRPAYRPDSAATTFLGLTARQSITPKFAAVGGFDLNFLDRTVRDSPIVEEDIQLFSFVGLIYIFGDAQTPAGVE